MPVQLTDKATLNTTAITERQTIIDSAPFQTFLGNVKTVIDNAAADGQFEISRTVDLIQSKYADILEQLIQDTGCYVEIKRPEEGTTPYECFVIVKWK